MTNATSFGKQAAVYAKGRPGYPPALFQWIADHCPSHQRVWDIGTGSGQAAHALTAHFKTVHATDISAEQIAAATPHSQISYHVAPANKSGLPSGSIDCITVATAVHWFADEAFWTEVSRAANKPSFFCAWTYQLPRCEPEVHKKFLDPLLTLIDPYWADGNRICMRGYSAEALNCPFQTLAVPKFDAGGIWSTQDLVNFTESWSAHFRAREAGLKEKLKTLSTNFLMETRDTEIHFDLPISLIAAHITK